MEKLQWFKFSPTDWMMGRIQRVPAETQIMFIRLMCQYWNKDCIMSLEDAEIEVEKEHLDLLLNKKIVKSDEGNIIIEFLNEQYAEIGAGKEGKSNNGKIGNLKRWHPKVYNQYITGKINLEQALIIANQSHSDSNPIANQSQNIADKIRVDNINNKLLSEIDISEVELSLVQSFKIAVEFQKLFIKNLKEKDCTTNHQEKATFLKYVNPIRLMLTNAECTVQDLRDVWDYLDAPESEFWKKNILSTEKLRKQITTLVMNSRERKKQKP